MSNDEFAKRNDNVLYFLPPIKTEDPFLITSQNRRLFWGDGSVYSSRMNARAKLLRQVTINAEGKAMVHSLDLLELDELTSLPPLFVYGTTLISSSSNISNVESYLIGSKDITVVPSDAVQAF